ncbi:MAG: biotin-dependent carboxyltransferase family protein [Acidobacteriota bacterium]|nr:biotin-dependent carboxyltransferase family protein [Acidobacteriota bacterium]
MTRIGVLAAGALTTIQDLGRPGWGHIGVPRSGAADRGSLVLANRLVGNEDGAAALETTLSGPRLRFDDAAEVALAGAPVAARVGDRVAPMNQAFHVHAGDELRVGTARVGLRTYVAFAGGIDAPRTLGSAATDVLTGLGPAPLSRGVVLQTRAAHTRGAWGGRTIPPPAPCPPPPSFELPDSVRLRVIVGPRSDWFSGESIKRLLSDAFTVSQASNRIGARLDGPRMERARGGELLSEGLVPGALQVPTDGRPILLLADHPTTGGYPVIAVVASHDLSLAAQLRPGQRLRFFA